MIPFGKVFFTGMKFMHPSIHSPSTYLPIYSSILIINKYTYEWMTS